MKTYPLLLLLLAAPAVAGDLGDTTGIDLSIGKAIKGKAPPMAAPSNAVSSAHESLTRAGIPVSTLIEVGEDKMNWTVTNVAHLAGVIEAASRATCQLQANSSNASGDFYKNGTMANIDGTVRGDLSRGCIAHQEATYAAVKPVAGPSLIVKKIRYGLPPTQHNAVIVYPAGGAGDSWMYTGIVFDGWKKQMCAPKDMTFLYEDWGPIRPVGGVHVEPRYWKANVQLLDDE